MKRALTKRIVIDGVLTAMALAIWVVEAQIPLPLPVPGIKLGLANVVTLFAMFALGPLDAGVILLVRIGLGSVFGGGLTAFLFSLAGGALCYLLCLLLRLVVKDKQIWVLGALGAIAHNAAQIGVAIALTRTTGLVVYLPVLVAAGVITGTLTGLAAQASYLALKRTTLLSRLKGGASLPKEPDDVAGEEDETEKKNQK